MAQKINDGTGRPKSFLGTMSQRLKKFFDIKDAEKTENFSPVTLQEPKTRKERNEKSVKIDPPLEITNKQNTPTVENRELKGLSVRINTPMTITRVDGKIVEMMPPLEINTEKKAFSIKIPLFHIDKNGEEEFLSTKDACFRVKYVNGKISEVEKPDGLDANSDIIRDGKKYHLAISAEKIKELEAAAAKVVQEQKEAKAEAAKVAPEPEEKAEAEAAKVAPEREEKKAFSEILSDIPNAVQKREEAKAKAEAKAATKIQSVARMYKTKNAVKAIREAIDIEGKTPEDIRLKTLSDQIDKLKLITYRSEIQKNAIALQHTGRRTELRLKDDPQKNIDALKQKIYVLKTKRDPKQNINDFLNDSNNSKSAYFNINDFKELLQKKEENTDKNLRTKLKGNISDFAVDRTKYLVTNALTKYAISLPDQKKTEKKTKKDKEIVETLKNDKYYKTEEDKEIVETTKSIPTEYIYRTLKDKNIVKTAKKSVESLQKLLIAFEKAKKFEETGKIEETGSKNIPLATIEDKDLVETQKEYRTGIVQFLKSEKDSSIKEKLLKKYESSGTSDKNALKYELTENDIQFVETALQERTTALYNERTGGQYKATQEDLQRRVTNAIINYYTEDDKEDNKTPKKKASLWRSKKNDNTPKKKDPIYTSKACREYVAEQLPKLDSLVLDSNFKNSILNHMPFEGKGTKEFSFSQPSIPEQPETWTLTEEIVKEFENTLIGRKHSASVEKTLQTEGTSHIRPISTPPIDRRTRINSSDKGGGNYR